VPSWPVAPVCPGRARQVASLVGRAVDWLAGGGALYFEVLVPRDLETFNRSRYAARTSFAVTSIGDGYQDWQYDGVADRHAMHSPGTPCAGHRAR
jgi:hypothetical protein